MPLRIVYIDDEPDLGSIFCDYFSSPDIEVQIFTDAQAGLDHVTTGRPDAVFLDFRMPGITGDQLAQQMSSYIPKFLITGEINPELSYSFQAVLPKPFDVPRIEQILSELARKLPPAAND